MQDSIVFTLITTIFVVCLGFFFQNKPQKKYIASEISWKDLILFLLALAYFPSINHLFTKPLDDYSHWVRAVTALWYLAIPIFFLPRGIKIYTAVISIIVFSFYIPHFFHLYQYGEKITDNAFVVMFETNNAESVEFFKSYFNLGILTAAVFLWLPIIAIIYFIKPIATNLKSNFKTVQFYLLLLWLPLNAYCFINFKYSIFYK